MRRILSIAAVALAVTESAASLLLFSLAGIGVLARKRVRRPTTESPPRTVIRKNAAGVLAGVFAVFILVGAKPAVAATITFDFTGAEGGPEGIPAAPGNVRTFTAGSVTVFVSSWGVTFGALDDAFEMASLGKWSTGLGSCNVEEVPCDATVQQVDNAGADDWLLFVFSEQVQISTVTIDPDGPADRDVSYYVGNVSIPPTFLLDLTGIGPAGLGALGFGPAISDVATVSGDSRDVAIGVAAPVNAFLLGGYLGDTDDVFKVTGLTAVTTVPEPASLLLFLTGAAALAGSRSRRRG
jgi:hypothetical protein